MTEDPVYMYIIMRNDLASMTPGRACAQASHAANHCMAIMRRKFIHDADEYARKLYSEYEHTTNQFFGTTIVLQASIELMKFTKQSIIDNPLDNPIYYDVTHDPTYAIKDGDVTHYIPLDTCLWIFGRRNDIRGFVSHLKLY